MLRPGLLEQGLDTTTVETEHGYYDEIDYTESIVRLFANNYMSRPALASLKLFEVAADFQDDTSPTRQEAALALAESLTSPDTPIHVGEIEYAAALLGDIPVIVEASANYRNRIEAIIQDEGDIPAGAVEDARRVQAMLDDQTAVVPKEDWENLRFGPNLPKLAELVEKVNVESVVIMAANSLDKVMRGEGSQTERLKTILEAETTYIPLLDAFGLSAYVMTFRNEINKVRLIEAGHGDLIKQARSNLESLNGIGLTPITESIFGATDDDPTFEVDTCLVRGGEYIHFGESELAKLTDGAFDGRLIRRVKTPISLADKMRTNPEYKHTLPQDVVGYTAIVKDERELVGLFNHVYKKLEDAGTVRFVTVPSKGSPVSIQGNEGFFARIGENLRRTSIGQRILEGIDEKSKVRMDKPTAESFQVLRVTFDIEVDGKQIPVEFQFQTERDRDNARLGGASHMFYKGKPKGVQEGDKASEVRLYDLLETISGDSDVLRRIHERGATLRNPSQRDDLTPKNSKSAQRFLEKLSGAL